MSNEQILAVAFVIALAVGLSIRLFMQPRNSSGRAGLRQALLRIVKEHGPQSVRDIAETEIVEDQDEAAALMSELVETGRCRWIEIDDVKRLVIEES